MWSDFTIDNYKKFTKYKLKNNNILLKYIRNERKKIKKTINLKAISINISEIHKDDIDIDTYIKGIYVDREGLFNAIQTLNKIYKIAWGDNFIIIKTDTIIELDERIKYMIHIIEYLKEKTNNYKHIKIYLILSNLKKEFPQSDKIMGIKNANSGYNNSVSDIIFIWRKEEFEKVIFHELFHNLELDKQHDVIPEIIKTDGPHYYFEAITDFQGVMYNLIYLSLLTKVSVKNLINYELGFIRNQAMTLNDIWGLGNWHRSPENIVEQKTAAFSYYILKYMIFEYYLTHKIDLSDNYKTILDNVLSKKFIQLPFVKLSSSRMTLLQLK